MNKYGKTAGNAFRLSICLRRFYTDERRRCYVSVWSGLRVRWLARRLRRLFSLSGHFCLLSAGHLLPPDEYLALLSPDDLVEAVPKHYKIFEDESESEDEELFDFSKKETPSNTINENHIDHNLQETNKQTIENGLNQQNEENNQTNVALTLQTCNNAITSKCYIPLSNLTEQDQNSRKAVENKKFEEVENEKLDEVKRKALELLDNCITPPKRKRKRVRRRKQHLANTGQSEGAEDTCEEPPSCQPRSRSHESEVVNTDNTQEESSAMLADSETLVVRNTVSHESRPARIVYSLS